MTEIARSHLGLRAHDVHQGLSLAEHDRDSGFVARDLEATQLVGRAAALAAWIKGLDVVKDAQKLKLVAAQQLDIDWYAFDAVVGVLEEYEFVRRVERDGHRITGFYEDVPATHEAMYDRLGEAFEGRTPGELEQILLATVDDLSLGPRLAEELAGDVDAKESILELGQEAGAISIVTVSGSQVAYSPLFAFEQPEAMADVLATTGVDQVREAFESVRRYQGMPVSLSESGDVLGGLVGSGLMAGPAVERPDRSMESFAIAPYGLSADLLVLRRPILDKASALVAAVRMGEHFGGATSLSDPVRLLNALQDSDRVVARHSSTERQYAVLHNMGIIEFVKSGNWSGIKLIPDKHGDNHAALDLAIELISLGEASASKEFHPRDEGALLVAGTYRTPLQSARRAKTKNVITPAAMREIIESAMGRRPF